MFTQGTRQFGTWRAGHPSLNRHTGRPTQAILLAYGFCAFLTWFIFIITLKVRGEFFLIESLGFPLHSISAEGSPSQVPSPNSTSIAIRSDSASSQLRVILDTGETFLIPSQQVAFENHLESRANQIELTSMLSKRPVAGRSAVVLWVDKSVALSSVSPIAKTIVRTGFDTVQYAVSQVNSGASGEAN
ncbi:MAG: hypothetical protein RJB13_1012 [Pseudomonadota bacterium]|jgi:biopolymer transport protein ExbD